MNKTVKQRSSSGLSVLNADIGTLKGIGKARAEALSKLGVSTVGDLLRLFPRGYQDRGNTLTLGNIRKVLEADGKGIFSSVLTVSSSPRSFRIRGGREILRFRAFDETGSVEITFFNSPFLKSAFSPGETYRFYGRFSIDGRDLRLAAPVYEKCADASELQPIVPVYPLTSGLTQKAIQSSVARALELFGDSIEDYIPDDDLKALGLPDLKTAFRSIHIPEDLSDLERSKSRMTFDELYVMYLLSMRKNAAEKKENTAVITRPGMDRFYSELPFTPTGAQTRAIEEIFRDMGSDRFMNRILAGDVGSGKTLVAEAAAYAAVSSGFSVLLMAPTELLARQHHSLFSRLFGPLGIYCACITGSTGKAERNRIMASLAEEGGAGILIGTHALLSEGVTPENTGLIIIDEQHRFGVMQRASLIKRSGGAHTLVMSATPIPRTLTLAAWGNIDISRLDEMPAGRQPVESYLVNGSYRERLNAFIRKTASEGHQTYVVCPAIEENRKESEEDSENIVDISLVDYEKPDVSSIQSAISEAGYLKAELPDLRISLLHGKMRNDEKTMTMAGFAEGKSDVLVSTTVIEVGVDVPNATLMIVENADRFGLAQLHQLRGRVGRGADKSYFIMMSDTSDAQALERLRKIKSTSDGFEIAEYDLSVRGPGDFFFSSGVPRQHGFSVAKLAPVCTDKALIEKAAAYAADTLKQDPDLSSGRNTYIRERVSRFEEQNEAVFN